MGSSDESYAPGSFRDPHGRVLAGAGDVVRLLDATAAAEWRALRESAFLRDAMDRGRIVRTRELGRLPEAASDPRWTLALEHERVPFLCWPYEWPFGMMKDAALLHLDLLLEALAAGFTMKDGSAYNVQWRGVRPCFIDLGSFVRNARGGPWVGYAQFCRTMLSPLLLQAHLDVDFQPLLRGSIDGLDAAFVSRLFGGARRLRRGVLTHVYLQARLEDRLGAADRDVRGELAAAGFDQRLVESNVRRMRRLIASLEWRRGRSEWSEYDSEHGYGEDDLRRKEAFVRDAVARLAPELCWDLGANTGRYSAIAAAHSRWVVAADADVLAVERHYRRLRRQGPANVLPIVFDVADPSPGLGFRGRERAGLEERGRPAMVLALALVHHLAIGSNLPLEALVAWLAGATTRGLVIEFVDREDPRVQRMLRDRDGDDANYCRERFESALGRHFEVEASLALEGRHRRLYRCSKRPA